MVAFSIRPRRRRRRAASASFFLPSAINLYDVLPSFLPSFPPSLSAISGKNAGTLRRTPTSQSPSLSLSLLAPSPILYLSLCPSLASSPDNFGPKVPSSPFPYEKWASSLPPSSDGDGALSLSLSLSLWLPSPLSPLSQLSRRLSTVSIATYFYASTFISTVLRQLRSDRPTEVAIFWPLHRDRSRCEIANSVLGGRAGCHEHDYTFGPRSFSDLNRARG